VTPQHDAAFAWRSQFEVYFRAPMSAWDAAAMLSRANPLTAAARAGAGATGASASSHAAAATRPGEAAAEEVVPPGSVLALIRRMRLVDDRGELVTCKLVESVQLRIYRAPVPGQAGASQAFQEFLLSREALFAGRNGGLVAIGPEDRQISSAQFPVPADVDPFERGNLAGFMHNSMGCTQCHGDPAVFGIMSGGAMRLRELDESGVGRPDSLQMRRNDYRWGAWQVLWQQAVAADRK
jgi:hypothetical protein